jgi:hypothetical protein
MPSPKRIFRNATLAEVQAAHAAALDRVTNGAFTSLSGGGTSSTKQYANDQEILFEASYELDVRNSTVKPTHTTQDFSELREHNTTVTG